jgi:hypothetical protein
MIPPKQVCQNVWRDSDAIANRRTHDISER